MADISPGFCSFESAAAASRSVAWRGVAWRGVAWRGVAWRGVAWRGVAWRGVAFRNRSDAAVPRAQCVIDDGQGQPCERANLRFKRILSF
jgi:hypothetical protein